MGRRGSSNFSTITLIASAALYLLLVGLILFFSRQVLQDLAQGASLTRLLFIPLGIVLPLFLLISFVVQLVRLIRDTRSGKPGSRFKGRLTLFFILITLFAALPQGVLTLTFITSSLEAWFNTEMEEALEGGLSIALRYNDETVDQLEAITTSRIFGEVLEEYASSDPEQVWQTLRSLIPRITSLQLFDSHGMTYAFFGNEEAYLMENPGEGPEGAISRTKSGENTFLRSSRKVPFYQDRGGEKAVLTILMPENFDHYGRELTKALDLFVQYRTYKIFFSLALILLYAVFALPLLLLSLLTAFQTGELIIRPIVHLEESMRKVMEGDYSIRILSGGRDELAILVRSFNEMVGELEISREKILQTEKVTAWQEIAQRMAHEIKNPLTPIKLSAERILRSWKKGSDNMETVIERSVDSIIREVDSLTTMLGQFRDFARMPAPTMRPVPVGELVDEAGASYSQAYPGISFSTEALAAEQILQVDPGQIKQVFSNLLKNAFEAVSLRTEAQQDTREGFQEKGRVYVGSDLVRKGNTYYCRIHIVDNGSGIPEELRDKVFQPYVTTKRTGTGLGLPIVERIISDHRGAIWFESAPGSGTTFYIDLPVESIR
jgi:two-component system, NtrC family, nitrogen regulation sensor histidine kinase NtrY